MGAFQLSLEHKIALLLTPLAVSSYAHCYSWFVSQLFALLCLHHASRPLVVRMAVFGLQLVASILSEMSVFDILRGDATSMTYSPTVGRGSFPSLS